MSDKIFFNERRFLNKETKNDELLTGFSVATVKLSSSYRDNEYLNVDGTLKIADCTRSIHLDFDMYDKEDIDIKIEKAEAFLNTVKQFVENLKIAGKEYSEILNKQEIRRKAEEEKIKEAQNNKNNDNSA